MFAFDARRVPRWVADGEEGSDWGDSEATRASTAVAAGDSQAVPQGTADSNGRVSLPEWALWLNGAVFTMLLAVIIALLYVVSTTRRRLASGTTVELNKVSGLGRTRIGILALSSGRLR